MGKIRSIVKLCRPLQWYKNLVVYLALIFTSQLFVPSEFLTVTLGFISLCLISSSNYVINDMIDRKKDRHHPEKKHRPIASGKIKMWEAVVMFLILMIVSVSIAVYLEPRFLAAVGFLFVFTQIYSFFLKKEVFVDILAIAINFVVRAVAGAFVIDVNISPWLILCTFFLSLFLSTGKRYSDGMLMGKKAASHRSTLKGYTKEVSSFLMIINTTLLIISYSLYSFLSDYTLLLWTLPFAIYTIFRYTQLVHEGSKIARSPELIFKDKRMMIGIAAWAVLVIAIITFF